MLNNPGQNLDLDNITIDTCELVYNVGRLKTIKKRFIINDGRIINLVDQEGYIGEEEEDEKYFSNLW